MAAGSLDPSFSGDGKATVLVSGEQFDATDVAVQTDGKAVVVGRSTIITAGTAKVQFATARFNIDGSLDTSFADAGIARAQLSEQHSSFANAVAIAPDGKIVVVGVTLVGEHQEEEVGVVRYNPNGSLDNSFSGDGKLGIDLTSSPVFGTTGADVAIQPDGRIIIVGTVSFDVNDDVFATRLNVDGSSDGNRFMDFGEHDDQYDEGVVVKIDGSGRVYVAGNVFDRNSRRQRVVLTRFTAGGPVEYRASFRLDQVTSVEDLILQPGGKVVIAGNTGADVFGGDSFVARFTDTGQLDTTFGGFAPSSGPGYRITVGASAFGITQTPAGAGGGFIVSGSAAVKYTDNGALDTTFGLNGIARVQGFGGAVRIAAGPGRRVVLAGGADFSTARLLLAGANVVSVGALDGSAGEGTTNTALLAVGRLERLPVPTRVYITIGGTATGTGLSGTRDYLLDNMVVPVVIAGGDPRPYVDIPANETFVFVTLTTKNDTKFEGSESATFTITPDPSYEIGTPGTGSVTITDDDRLSFQIGTAKVNLPPKHVEEGEEVSAAVTWAVPTGGWRQLSSVRLRLRDLDDDDALVLLTFDEATNSFSLDVTAAAAGAVALVPSKSNFSAAGPTAPTVTVTFTFRFTAAGAGRRFAVDAAADNDAGDFSGFSEFGKTFVRKKVKKH